MARMFPNKLLEGTRSNAERKVYTALRDGLPDAFRVLHGVPIYRKSHRDGRLIDGEADVLIAHPDKGLVVLEVKGGGIEVSAEEGQWFSWSYGGAKYEIKDPYEQAKTCLYAILDELSNHHLTRKHSYPAGHAVWFPDIDFSGGELGRSRHLGSITLDASALDAVETSINRIFKNAVGKTGARSPDTNGIDALTSFLAPSTKMVPCLARSIQEDDQRILEATQSQYKALSLLQRRRRALISGPAGSGKTFLAMEKARRIVEDDEKASVLTVCFNNRLAGHLRRTLSGSDGIDVFTFHQLCQDFCEKAGMKLKEWRNSEERARWFMSDLPEAFMESLSVVDDRYDAVIVDEGQDFDSTWWIPLMDVLREPDEGVLYIFYDDNQILYERERNFPLEGPAFTLTENCRNTQRINEVVVRYYQGDAEPVAIGPPGIDPTVIALSESEDEKTAVATVVRELISNQRVSPRDIILLTPRSRQKSMWTNGDSLCGCRFVWSDEESEKGNTIRCSTIHAFKGLESPVVIVTEMDKVFEGRKEQLLYVAVSRARSHLILVRKASAGAP